MPRSAGTYVALLRGINVGGKNMLPMAALIEMFVLAKCDDVRTYVQSGNVVFTADPGMVTTLPSVLAQRITERFGLRVPVLLRSAKDLLGVTRRNPFLASGADPEKLAVAFLADQPKARDVEALDPGRSPPDAFAVRGREIYLFLRNGAARTKLTNAYFDSRLGTTSTARNWRTVTNLAQLAVLKTNRPT
jgi:uncharacterized protein (DUF1697 family)